MIRIIHSANGEQEKIYITEDLAEDASEFIVPDWEIVSDEIYDIELPSSFPTETSFKKEY